MAEVEEFAGKVLEFIHRVRSGERGLIVPYLTPLEKCAEEILKEKDTKPKRGRPKKEVKDASTEDAE